MPNPPPLTTRDLRVSLPTVIRDVIKLKTGKTSTLAITSLAYDLEEPSPVTSSPTLIRKKSYKPDNDVINNDNADINEPPRKC